MAEKIFVVTSMADMERRNTRNQHTDELVAVLWSMTWMAGPHQTKTSPRASIIVVIHSQKKQLTQLYIFISACIELSLYSWIAALDDGLQLSKLFLLRVYQKKDEHEWPHPSFFCQLFGQSDIHISQSRVFCNIPDYIGGMVICEYIAVICDFKGSLVALDHLPYCPNQYTQYINPPPPIPPK